MHSIHHASEMVWTTQTSQAPARRRHQLSGSSPSHEQLRHRAYASPPQREGGSGGATIAPTPPVLEVSSSQTQASSGYLQQGASDRFSRNGKAQASGILSSTPEVLPVDLARRVPPSTTAVDKAAPPANPLAGYGELLLVSGLWGSYNPALRILFSEPDPLDASTLTAVRTLISASAMLSATVFFNWQSGQASSTAATSTASALHGNKESTAGNAVGSNSKNGDNSHADGTRSAFAQPFSLSMSPASNHVRLGGILTRNFNHVMPAGIEIGILNFMGTALQAQGLTHASATRAGFLVMLTGVLTPLISYLAGSSISTPVWAAVALGLAGSGLVAYDALPQTATEVATSAAAAAPTTLAVTGGEGLLLASCFFFSLGTVRLGQYAPRLPSLDLACMKKLTLAASSLGWAAWHQQALHTAATAAAAAAAVGGAASIAATADGGSSGLSWLLPPELWERSAASWALIVYSALGPGALATYMQTAGQATVPAPQAQVIYSLTPLWSAALAYIFLGDEVMGPVAYAGGGAIVVAGLLAAFAQRAGQGAAVALVEDQKKTM